MSGDYNFSLSSEQEQHAQQLHADAISIDMCSMGPGGPALYDRLPEDVVEDRLPESMHPIQRFIVGMELPYSLSAEGATDALQTFCQGHTCASFAMGGVTDTELQGLENLNKNVENIPWMSFADTAEDFRRAKAEGTYVTYGFGQPGLAGTYQRNLDCNEMWHVGTIDWNGTSGSFTPMQQVSTRQEGNCR